MLTLTELAHSEIAHLVGHRTGLRLVQPDDAEFIFDLRTDPRYNRHLSPVTGSAEDQRVWISEYKQRETRLEELYYVIERRDGTPCGVVRLYSITHRNFEWGSFILNRSKPAKAALESAVLSLGIGFERLGLSQAIIEARKENDHAISFYRRLGVEQVGADTLNLYFVYDRNRFRNRYNDFVQALAKT